MSRTVQGLLAAALFVAAWFFHARYADHGMAVFDLGVLLDGAGRLQRGESFGGDFIAPYGPLRYAVIAAWFELFGSNLASYSWFSVFSLSAIGSLLFLAALRWTSVSGALAVSACFALAHGPLHKCVALWLMAAVVVAAVWWLEKGWRGASLCGLVAGIVFVGRYDVGAFAMVAVIFGLALTDSRGSPRLWVRAVGASAGWAVVVGATLALLAAGGFSLGWWWELTWQRIDVQELVEVEFPWPRSGGEWGPLRRLILFAAMLVALAVELATVVSVVVRRVHGRSIPGDPARACIALFGLLLLNQLRLIASINRLFQVSIPVFFCLADLCARRGRRAWTQALVWAWVVALLAWVHTHTEGLYPGSYTARLERPELLELPGDRGGVWLSYAEAQLIRAVVAEIEQHVAPGDCIATSPHCPLFSFLTSTLR